MSGFISKSITEMEGLELITFSEKTVNYGYKDYSDLEGDILCSLIIIDY